MYLEWEFGECVWPPWPCGGLISWAVPEVSLKSNQLFSGAGNAWDKETTFSGQKEKEVTGGATEGNPWLGKAMHFLFSWRSVEGRLRGPERLLQVKIALGLHLDFASEHVDAKIKVAFFV